MKVTPLARILLLITCLLAAYQVVAGINGLDSIPTIAYTIGFGVLLVAALLMIILGYEVLDSPVVVVVSSIIPLSLSLGLVWEYSDAWRFPYLVFTIMGFLAVIITRIIPMTGRLPIIILALVHGIAGMVLFLLPAILAGRGVTNPGFALISLGGAMIGLGGLLLYFLKTGKPIVSRETILQIFPAVLFLMTIAFVTGFALA
jgi:hypothetical protein